MTNQENQRLLLQGLATGLEAFNRDPAELAAKALGISAKRVVQAQVVRRALDARRGRPRFILHLRVELSKALAQLPANAIPDEGEAELPEPAAVPGRPEVIVVGAGPAGLFAAWRLCQAGIAPLVVDRGPGFPARHEAVARLQQTGELDPEANFHFGLGGAGAYSDGKLYTRLGRPGVRTVLRVLQSHGAGSRDQILVDAHPHVGTDRWPPTLEGLVADLRKQGCRFSFDTRVSGITTAAGRLTGLRTDQGELACQAVLLAPGNSARDLFEALPAAGVAIEAKAFALGVRITHPQALIDSIQFGKLAGHPALGPANYRLSGRFGDRAVYSFCMCPGGTVVPTPTEPEGLCLNGMSNSGRDSGEANAAIVVSVGAADFGQDPLGGIALQRRIERAAFEAGGGNNHAPAQTLLDFLDERAPGPVPENRYRPGVRPAALAKLFPDPVSAALREGLGSFCKRMRGLGDAAAVLLGVEARTSSPVRILRNPDGMNPGLPGLFPAGEGAGYAGGISSSAVDGIRAADLLMDHLRSGT